MNLHPDNEHIIYPLGSSVIVRHIVTRTQTFLNGHDNLISALTVSSKGNYIASGQQTYGGFQVNYKNEEKKSCFEFAFFSNNIKLISYSLKKKKKADLVIWSFKEKIQSHRLRLHKVVILSLDFSKNENFLVSAGGLEDKNTIVIWNVETGKATYSYSFAGNSPISSVRFYNRTDEKLIVVQENNVHLVSLEPAKRKVCLIKNYMLIGLFFLKRRKKLNIFIILNLKNFVFFFSL